MMKLLSIEWMKLKRSATMKAILGVYVVAVPLIWYLLSLFVIPIGPPEAGMTWKFPETIVFTTNELKYKTQRQNVIDGLSKRDVIISKFIVVFGLTAVVTLYTFIVGLVFALIHGGENGLLEGVHHIGAYFISTLGYLTFAFFFANLVRLPALAIVLYLFSTIIEGIVGAVTVQQYAQYFPLSTFSDLIPVPLLPAGAPNPYILTEFEKMGLASVYILIFVAISYWVIKKRDI
jgi:hypothetical protein